MLDEILKRNNAEKFNAARISIEEIETNSNEINQHLIDNSISADSQKSEISTAKALPLDDNSQQELAIVKEMHAKMKTNVEKIRKNLAPKTMNEEQMTTANTPKKVYSYTLDIANDFILALSLFFDSKRAYVHEQMQSVDFIKAAVSIENSSTSGGSARNYLLAAYETLNKALKKCANGDSSQADYIPIVQKQLKKMFVDIIVKVQILEQNGRSFGAKEVLFVKKAANNC